MNRKKKCLELKHAYSFFPFSDTFHVHVQWKKKTNNLRKSMTTIDSSHVHMAPLAKWEKVHSTTLMAVARMSRDYMVCRLLNVECFCLFLFFLRVFSSFAATLHICPYLRCSICSPLAVTSLVHASTSVCLTIFRFFINFLCCNSWHAYIL